MQQTLAVGWFPETEWATALARWPELGDDLPDAHPAYLSAVEKRLREVSAQAEGTRLVPVPLTIAEIDERAEVEGLDAGSAELRGRTASLLLTQGRGSVWPPGRNDPCWCESARKYKRCCGSKLAGVKQADTGPQPNKDRDDG